MMNKKKKKLVSRREIVFGKDFGKEIGMFEKLKVVVIIVKKENNIRKDREMDKEQIMFYFQRIGNYFKILFKKIKVRSEKI